MSSEQLREQNAGLVEIGSLRSLPSAETLALDQNIHHDRQRIERTITATKLLTHAVRRFADEVDDLKRFDPNLTNLTAGNPPVYGFLPPSFVLDAIPANLARSMGYANSVGELQAREELAKNHRVWSPDAEPLHPDKILVTNGVAHAIGMIIELIGTLYHGTVLIPGPDYPSFKGMAGLHQLKAPPSYTLDPEKKWEIDLGNMEKQLVLNPHVEAILLIHPNNPTGALYSAETLRSVLLLAKKHKKMVVCDEIYFQMILNGKKFQDIIPIAEREEVPLLILRGSSKDLAAPGMRFGWVQAHGTEQNPLFAEFWKALRARMRAEVSANTLPQLILPKAYLDPRYQPYISEYRTEVKTIMDDFSQILRTAPGVEVSQPEGGIYLLITFKEGFLKPGQKLPLKAENAEMRRKLQEKLDDPNIPLDEHFVFSQIGYNGIVTIPATGFSAPPGFRITALIRDPEKRRQIAEAIVQAITEYTESVK